MAAVQRQHPLRKMTSTSLWVAMLVLSADASWLFADDQYNDANVKDVREVNSLHDDEEIVHELDSLDNPDDELETYHDDADDETDDGEVMDDEPSSSDNRNNAVKSGSSFGWNSDKRLTMKRPKKPTLPNERAEINSMSEIVSRLLKQQFYDKYESPTKDRPTEVKLGIYINSFYSISEQTMDYSVSMYLRQSWNDPRLAFKSFNTRLEKIRLGDNSWNEIWIPDTFFRNEKAAQFHEVTVKNRLLRLSANGDLWYVTKISAVLSCPMTLHKYPLDTQTCPMMFESFGYTMDTMYFTWLDDTVEIDAGVKQLPQFFLEDKVLYDCSQNYTAGAFPCLEIRFILRRDIGYFLIQVYVPSILIVILSWVSFWINVEGSPARVSLGLLTVLTTTTMSAGARASLPRVSYIKAIDVWMIVCLIFVFASLIEYAIVNVLSRRTAPSPPTTSTIASAPAAPTAYLQSSSTASLPHSCTVSLGRVGGGSSTAYYRRAPLAEPLLRSPSCGSGKMKRSGSVPSSTTTTWRVPQASLTNGGSSDCGRAVTLLSAATDGLRNQSPPPLPSQTTSIQMAAQQSVDGKLQARRVDKLSRKCFPLAFVLFNAVYWVVYTTPSSFSDS